MPNAALFDSFKIKSLTLRNRIGVSPMCMYSCDDGVMNDWHLVHLGSRAVGGAALVIAEATAVTPDGRITNGCSGIWADKHIEPLARAFKFIKAHGAVAGIQIAHAGRKASAALPWNGGAHLSESEGGWQTIAPSPISYGSSLPKVPREMSLEDIKRIQSAFQQGATRALAAGAEWIEIHAAHGYLTNEFLSPLTNQRTDSYGGSFENRIRFLIETLQSVKKVWPEKLPLSVRISATDWADGGWEIEQSIELAKILKKEGVDLIDCSSGGIVHHQKITVVPGYQVPFSERIRKDAQIATAAVGLITEANQANEIIKNGQADLVLLAREFLRDPYWPAHAAKALGCPETTPAPKQYLRSW